MDPECKCFDVTADSCPVHSWLGPSEVEYVYDEDVWEGEGGSAR